jgi:hypothetical protein
MTFPLPHLSLPRYPSCNRILRSQTIYFIVMLVSKIISDDIPSATPVFAKVYLLQQVLQVTDYLFHGYVGFQDHL